MEEAKEKPIKFVAGASQCFLLVVTRYGNGACKGTRGVIAELVSRVGEATRPSVYAHND